MTFIHCFKLSGIDGSLPAGEYCVETDEELLQSLSFPAYRRIASTIRLPSLTKGKVMVEVVTIDPVELDAALERDAALAEVDAAASPEVGG